MFRAGLVALSFMWALCAHGKVLYTGDSTPGSLCATTPGRVLSDECVPRARPARVRPAASDQ